MLPLGHGFPKKIKPAVLLAIANIYIYIYERGDFYLKWWLTLKSCRIKIAGIKALKKIQSVPRKVGKIFKCLLPYIV